MESITGKKGSITRGVLLDVPKHRGRPYVTMEAPVHGWELEDIAKAQGVALEPGDALVVYSGREDWDRDGNPAWGSDRNARPRPPLFLPHVSSGDGLASMLVWDMADFIGEDYDMAASVHSSIAAYGLALLDNALLQPLAEACAEERAL